MPPDTTMACSRRRVTRTDQAAAGVVGAVAVTPGVAIRRPNAPRTGSPAAALSSRGTEQVLTRSEGIDVTDMHHHAAYRARQRRLHDQSRRVFHFATPYAPVHPGQLTPVQPRHARANTEAQPRQIPRDRQEANPLSFLNHQFAKTPHVDAMAKNGVHLKFGPRYACRAGLRS